MPTLRFPKMDAYAIVTNFCRIKSIPRSFAYRINCVLTVNSLKQTKHMYEKKSKVNISRVFFDFFSRVFPYQLTESRACLLGKKHIYCVVGFIII